ncbi:MAG TPA: iron chelate uptake ABC transporter family permease subunit, partial [Marmoricola sp.]|nr:iron chelate uptake ABC transporter family permease subunit [Marmoricola sp.]
MSAVGTSCAPVARTTTSQDVVRRARRRPARRTRLVVGGLAAALLLAFAARTMLGDFLITVPDFFRILAGDDIPGASYILMESKLPRAVLGVLVGGALGLGGAIFQTTLRNPLASPDIIGVSLGASAAAVFAIVTLAARGWTVSAAAVLGALAVAVLVRWQAGAVGRSGAHRLVLIGIGVSAALQSVVQYLFTRADVYDAQLVLRWLTGSLNAASWPVIR